MKKLLKILGINEKIYNRLDDGEKSLIQILGLTVPVSAVVTGLVFYYAIDLLLDNTLISLFGGAFIGLFLYLHDRTMLSNKGVSRAYFRLAMSILFALIMSVPVKVNLMGDTMNKVFADKMEMHNRQVDADLLEAKEVLLKEERAIDSELAEAGKRYDQNNKNTQQLIEVRRKKKNFLAQKETRTQALEKLYEAKKKPTEASKFKLCGFFFVNFFNGEASPEESLYNAMILVILLMFESLPAIIRLKLESGDYLKKVDHQTQISREIERKRERIETGIFNEEFEAESMGCAFDKLDLLKELEEASRGDLSENREALIEKAKQLKRDDKADDLSVQDIASNAASNSEASSEPKPSSTGEKTPTESTETKPGLLKKNDKNNFPKFDY